MAEPVQNAEDLVDSTETVSVTPVSWKTTQRFWEGEEKWMWCDWEGFSVLSVHRESQRGLWEAVEKILAKVVGSIQGGYGGVKESNQI